MAQERLVYGPLASQSVVLDGPVDGPLAVLLHGGWWRARHALDLMTPLADDLARRGWRTANVEFRRIDGDGGGWPMTLDDVLAALDALAGPGAPRGAGPPVLVGHSAGGHLALLAAGRRPVAGVVALAPITDLIACADEGLGEGAVVQFLGAAPADAPEVARAASPLASLPVGAPLLVVQGDADVRVPAAHTRRFVAAARASGDDVTALDVVDGDHFVVIDPDAPVWAEVVTWMERVADTR